ncbi:shikimate kinase AroK [Agaribacterium haliotis]|uniref:shikimate kinase AroK n=1 Tax=Agaribacterium haliotis TaxID=2013869 RepID=UPI000BB540D1|nr:shikimate kinase AroK [Agaribacterium haliotis]
MKARNVVLIGPMGAGKSTIGRLLAAKLHFDFVDTDHVIEERTGADIAWIFDVEGEQGFREREHLCLKELVVKPGIVLATGGGIVCREDNRALIAAADAVVYLRAGVEQLLARTAKDKKRPLLQVDDPRSKIISLLEQRAPFYESVADYCIDTDGLNPKSTVQSILKLIQV